MDNFQLLNIPQIPKGTIDAVLDTDTYNEVDDQFALAYMLRSEERINCRAIYAAPFTSHHADTPAEGMEKSYQEILNVLRLCGREEMAKNSYRGATAYLPNEQTPVLSDAVHDLVARAHEYTEDAPLYVVAIGAITNVASALLVDPGIAKKIVVIWLGGHALHWEHNREFNLMQDIAAARVVMRSGVPMVLLPCSGVVSAFTVSVPELRQWLSDANPLCDYLVDIVAQFEARVAKGKPWVKAIWDVTAVAWLLNDGECFMQDRIIKAPLPEYSHSYTENAFEHSIRYVWNIKRNALFADLFEKLRR
ncbi:MAG: nucleoside hydrolase [Clostridia bacterium]|nr:nucleoside hydrolase [Clostridia bacterium]